MSSRLQRSAVSFRRQGLSGCIWGDPLRGLDLKGSSTPTVAAAVAPLAEASLACDPSPRAAISSRSFRHDAAAAVSIPEIPKTAPHVQPSPTADDGGANGACHKKSTRQRQRILSAFCACLGHPPASHAQQ